jgi:hypothetical protein
LQLRRKSQQSPQSKSPNNNHLATASYVPWAELNVLISLFSFFLARVPKGDQIEFCRTFEGFDERLNMQGSARRRVRRPFSKVSTCQ